MIPYSLPEPSNIKAHHFTMLTAALLLLTVAFLADRGLYWYRHWQTPFTFPKNQMVPVLVGQTEFRIPAGYIRQDNRRTAVLNTGAQLPALGLAITWPDLGMPDNSRSDLSGSPKIINIDIKQSTERETLRSQLEPFYKRLARGGETRGPSGLNTLNLSADTAEQRDQIVYDRAEKNGFIARCVQKTAWSTATCQSTLPVSGDLELTYRFDQRLLSEWRLLDQTVALVLESFQKTK